MQRQATKRTQLARFCSVLALSAPAVLAVTGVRAEQPPLPCHPNPTADADEAAVRSRGDIVHLPGELQDRLALLANRPHTYPPLQVFAESRRGQPTVPILFAGHEWFRAQRLYRHNPRGE